MRHKIKEIIKLLNQLLNEWKNGSRKISFISPVIE
jgi:hypothetical protein